MVKYVIGHRDYVGIIQKHVTKMKPWNCEQRALIEGFRMPKPKPKPSAMLVVR